MASPSPSTSTPTPTPTVPAPTPTTTATDPKICFISGPLLADTAYLTTHYTPHLLRALSANHHFLLGPSRGIDTLALHYLLSQSCAPSRITLYLPPTDVARYAWFAEQGGKIVVSSANHDSRDESMTRASHYDVLRYRTQEECRALFGVRYKERVSGTQKNEIRRKSGVGLVWREVVGEMVEAAEAAEGVRMGEDARRRRGLERKVKGARVLRERLEKGEVLERNQVEKAEKLEAWERELEGLK
ncbi:hypothetical protein P167DRAFT_563401 [Morchella conica CCBAS932]|uniref:Uncharacterized protein n=1 Tax=Morchella conica CCBAS932 TaxID=1392247 RepID=A0A3N4KWX6_9PEZI|nr:hypothetical protein P167DRAFT_563401 [Morchella conica CCBAS932]